MFLVTLVTYPFAFLLAQAAAAAEGASRAAVGGAVIDTRKRLQDFPEGAAIADLERWESCAYVFYLVFLHMPMWLD